jgi:hypothetical protein
VSDIGGHDSVVGRHPLAYLLELEKLAMRLQSLPGTVELLVSGRQRVQESLLLLDLGGKGGVLSK